MGKLLDIPGVHNNFSYDMCRAQLFPHCYFNQVCVGDSIKIKLKKVCIGDGLFSFI